jgi:hypothetical protein
MKNTGVDIEREIKEQSEKDWRSDDIIFGGSLATLALMPIEKIQQYLPKGELQFGREDFMDCVTRAYLNVIEAGLNYLIRNDGLPDKTIEWLYNNGYIVFYE